MFYDILCCSSIILLAIGSSNEESTEKLQTAINQIQKWTKKWNIQLNQSKSIHINFTNRCLEHIPITREYRMLTQLNILA